MVTRLMVRRLGPYVSEGSRLLWAAIQRRGLSLASAAELLGVAHHSMIGRWLRGEQRPGGRGRAMLHEVFEIAPSAWDRAPSRPFSLEAA